MATHQPPTKPPLTLGPDDEGRLVSAEEFAEAEYVEPYTYERVDGRLVVMSPEGKKHATTSSPWRNRLGAYQLAHPEIVQEVFPNPWVRVSEKTDRIGDIGVYLVRPDGAFDYPDQAPDIIFEIVSKASKDRKRDYVEKRAEYDRIGIPEYVIVDGFQRRVTVLTRGPGGYQERILKPGDIYTTPLLPTLAIPLDEVLKP